MAITSMDGLVNGLIRYPTELYKDSGTAEAAGVWHTSWYMTGNPGAGAAPSGGLNGATFTGPVNGQISVPAAVAGLTSYLTRLTASQAGNIGLLRIYDKIWGNVPVVTTTTGQSVTSPTWPARDVSASTTGVGVGLAMEVSSATGNGSPITNTTVTYTNTAGTGSRTATIASFPATAVAGTWVPFSLAAGDLGVKSVQTVTLGTSYVSGAIHVVAYRLIAEIPLTAANIAVDRNFTSLNMPAVWDNSVLFAAYLPSGTALGVVTGSVGYAQG